MNNNLFNPRSGLRAAFGKQFCMVLAIALTVVSNLQAQEFGTMSWGPSQPYDVGFNPSVAASGSYIVEVHNGQNGPGPMWYHAGQYSFNFPSNPSITWEPYEQYDWGYNPSVAGCPLMNTVVEVHNGQGEPGPMWYHLGVSGAYGVSWGPPMEYDEGWNPKVAIVCDAPLGYLVIEVHNGMFSSGEPDPMTMYYHVGVINPSGPDVNSWTITWGPAYSYDVGWDPSVAAVGLTVVEVHNNASATPGSLWYHVGTINSNLTVTWGPPYSYDVGWEPKVALTVIEHGSQPPSLPLVFEAHNGMPGSFGPMWYHLGQVGQEVPASQINWGPAVEYDEGWNPSIAWLWMFTNSEDYYLGGVEVHNGQQGFGTMWSHGDLWVPPGGFTVTGSE